MANGYKGSDLWCLSIVAALLLFGAFAHAETFPPVSLENTEQRPIHSHFTDRDYLLSISYPNSYGYSPERRYPVVYMTDAYWNFHLIDALGSKLMVDRLVPEYILVGIGYEDLTLDYSKERLYELTPSPQDYGRTASANARMGGARKFLDAIKNEIIPYIEENTRADREFRVLSGSSTGGLFSLFALYEEPALFDGIIAISPHVGWDHLWLLRREDELRFRALGNDYQGTYSNPTTLHMSVAEFDIPAFVGPIKALDSIIANGDYKDFAYQFREIEGEGHASSNAESFNWGMRFIFKTKPDKPVE